MNEQTIISFIDTEVSAGTNYLSTIQQERTRALKYYNRDAFGNEKKGRSTYVSSEVQETISWALPQIMKIFSGNSIIKFDAISPQYKDSARLATLYAENVLHKQNNGFLVLHNFFHDALLQKNGFLKVYYDKEDIFETEEYAGLSDAELAILLNDINVEPVTHDSITVVNAETGQSLTTHDVTIKRKITSTGGRIKIMNIPVEEVVVSKSTRSLDLNECPFIAHRVKKSISWLREQGYKISDDINDGTEASTDYSIEKMTRETQDGSFYSSSLDIRPVDPSMRLVWVTEAYFRVDYNNDGIAELRKVLKVGDTILENEEVYCQPFISTSPFPKPHLFYGNSMADLVADLQLLKSMLTRAMLDSFAFNINPSKAVNIDNIVDPNDLLNTNPGNYIRVRGAPSNSIQVMPSSGIGSEAFTLMTYIDDIAESRSGVSKSTQGIDKNSFNNTATGTQMIMSASQEKLALIVRIFAETAIAPLYRKIIELASKYSDGPELIQYSSNYINVNPIEWRNLKALSVNVGTGSVDKDKELANITSIIQLQKDVNNSSKPELNSMLDPTKIFNAINDMIKNMGYSPEQYFNMPGSAEYSQVYQYNQQQAMMAQQAAQQQQVDPNASLAEAEKIKSNQELLIKTANFELDKLKSDREFELKKYEIKLKYELELMKLQKLSDPGYVQQELSEIDSLNPSNELLSQSEINTLSKVFGNEGQDPRQSSIYAQILADQDTKRKMDEEQRQVERNKQDGLLNMIENINNHITKPKEIVRDNDGNIIGIRGAE
jgi:hypothetical protein